LQIEVKVPDLKSRFQTLLSRVLDNYRYNLGDGSWWSVMDLNSAGNALAADTAVQGWSRLSSVIGNVYCA